MNVLIDKGSLENVMSSTKSKGDRFDYLISKICQNVATGVYVIEMEQAEFVELCEKDERYKKWSKDERFSFCSLDKNWKQKLSETKSKGNILVLSSMKKGESFEYFKEYGVWAITSDSHNKDCLKDKFLTLCQQPFLQERNCMSQSWDFSTFHQFPTTFICVIDNYFVRSRGDNSKAKSVLDDFLNPMLKNFDGVCYCILFKENKDTEMYPREDAKKLVCELDNDYKGRVKCCVIAYSKCNGDNLSDTHDRELAADFYHIHVGAGFLKEKNNSILMGNSIFKDLEYLERGKPSFNTFRDECLKRAQERFHDNKKEHPQANLWYNVSSEGFDEEFFYCTTSLL